MSTPSSPYGLLLRSCCTIRTTQARERLRGPLQTSTTWYNHETMSKAQIIAELPRLSAQERAEVQAKLDELAGDAWLDRGELSDADKQMLNATLAAYEKSPDSGSSWDEVKARVQGK